MSRFTVNTPRTSELGPCIFILAESGVPGSENSDTTGSPENHYNPATVNTLKHAKVKQRRSFTQITKVDKENDQQTGTVDSSWRVHGEDGQHMSTNEEQADHLLYLNCLK